MANNLAKKIAKHDPKVLAQASAVIEMLNTSRTQLGGAGAAVEAAEIELNSARQESYRAEGDLARATGPADDLQVRADQALNLVREKELQLDRAKRRLDYLQSQPVARDLLEKELATLRQEMDRMRQHFGALIMEETRRIATTFAQDLEKLAVMNAAFEAQDTVGNRVAQFRQFAGALRMADPGQPDRMLLVGANGAICRGDGTPVAAPWRVNTDARDVVDAFAPLWDAACTIGIELERLTPTPEKRPTVERGPSVTMLVTKVDLPSDAELRALLRKVQDDHPKLVPVRDEATHFQEFKTAFQYVSGLNRLVQPDGSSSTWLADKGRPWTKDVHNAAYWLDRYSAWAQQARVTPWCTLPAMTAAVLAQGDVAVVIGAATWSTLYGLSEHGGRPPKHSRPHRVELALA